MRKDGGMRRWDSKYKTNEALKENDSSPISAARISPVLPTIRYYRIYLPAGWHVIREVVKCKGQSMRINKRKYEKKTVKDKEKEKKQMSGGGRRDGWKKRKGG